MKHFKSLTLTALFLWPILLAPGCTKRSSPPQSVPTLEPVPTGTSDATPQPGVTDAPTSTPTSAPTGTPWVAQRVVPLAPESLKYGRASVGSLWASEAITVNGEAWVAVRPFARTLDEMKRQSGNFPVVWDKSPRVTMGKHLFARIAFVGRTGYVPAQNMADAFSLELVGGKVSPQFFPVATYSNGKKAKHIYIDPTRLYNPENNDVPGYGPKDGEAQ